MTNGIKNSIFGHSQLGAIDPAYSIENLYSLLVVRTFDEKKPSWALRNKQNVKHTGHKSNPKVICENLVLIRANILKGSTSHHPGTGVEGCDESIDKGL